MHSSHSVWTMHTCCCKGWLPGASGATAGDGPAGVAPGTGAGGGARSAASPGPGSSRYAAHMSRSRWKRSRFSRSRLLTRSSSSRSYTAANEMVTYQGDTGRAEPHAFSRPYLMRNRGATHR